MKIPEPRKLKSGTWFIQLRLNGISVPVTGSTKTECQNAAALIKAEHKAGKRMISEKKKLPTLSAAIDSYIEKRKNTLSPSTITGYRRIQSGRFKDSMNRPIDQLTDWQVICDREALLCSPKTLKNAFRFICSVLKENGIAAPAVTLPTMIPHTREWLDPDQIKTLVASVKGTEDQLPVYFALHSLRLSEILALDWENIDLKNSRFKVSGAMVRDVDGKLVYKSANKNPTSNRTLPFMIPELFEALSAVPDKQRSGRVVTSTQKTVLAAIKRACKNAGVPEVGTHGLRHSFASLAYHLGMSERETMEIGGWGDTQTMHKIYTHLAAKDRLSAENKMASFYKDEKSKESVTEKMELTQEEKHLIEILREIDKKNPLGVDAYTENHYIETFVRVLEGVAEEAGRRYRAFIEEKHPGKLIDLQEAQRGKRRWEDTRSTAEAKADYEKTYKQYGLPAPIWKVEPGP